MGITVLRCDDRLIHGQCIVKVLNDYKIDYIILVDAFTASNPVMSNIYKMSVPPNVHLDVASAQSAIALIEQAEKSSERTLVLVKDPIIALELQKNCTVLPKALNIGSMSNRKGTKRLLTFRTCWIVKQRRVKNCMPWEYVFISNRFRVKKKWNGKKHFSERRIGL